MTASSRWRGLGLALLLSAAMLAGTAAWVVRQLQVALPADRIIASLDLGNSLGAALGRQLAAFAGSLLLAHAAFGLLVFGAASLTTAAFPGIPVRRSSVAVFAWFAVLAALVFGANATWFPASIFSAEDSWWRSRWIGLHPVEMLAAATIITAIALATRAAMLARTWVTPVACAAGTAAFLYVAVVGVTRDSVTHPAPQAGERPHVVIVGIDSLRSDLSLPRGGPPRVPNIEAFLAEARVFTDTTTPLARTFGSWVSILTGRHPTSTNARVNLMPRTLVDAGNTLGDALRTIGYRAVFATDEARFANIDASYGFDQVISPPIGAQDILIVQAGDMPWVNVVSLTPAGKWLFPWLHANRAAYVTYRPTAFVRRLDKEIDIEGPTFLAVHLTLAHWPYSWAGSAKPGTPDAYRAAYRRAIEAVDEQLESVMGVLASKGVLENAVVVLLSDHGEALGGQGDSMLRKSGTPLEIWRSLWGHGTSVLSPHQYATLLAIRSYGRADFPGTPGPHTWPVTLEDVRPTLEHFVFGKSPGQYDGLSLLPYLADPRRGATLSSRIRFTETDFNTRNTLAGNFRAEQVVDEAVDNYELDRATGWIQFRKDRLQHLLAQKQRAAVGANSLLAEVPGSSGEAPVRYLYTDRLDPLPRALESPPDARWEPEARRLWEALQARFAGELPPAAVVPRM